MTWPPFGTHVAAALFAPLAALAQATELRGKVVESGAAVVGATIVLPSIGYLV